MKKDFDSMLVEIYKHNLIRKDCSNQQGLWFSYCDLSEIYHKNQNDILHTLNQLFSSESLERIKSTLYFPTLNSNFDISYKEYFSLKAALHLGFSLDSKQANEFRSWTVEVIFSYIINGYSINDHFLDSEKLEILKSYIYNLGSKFKYNNDTSDHKRILSQIYKNYLKGFDLIKDFSYKSLKVEKEEDIAEQVITYNNAISLIKAFRELLNENEEFGLENENTDPHGSFHYVFMKVMHNFSEKGNFHLVKVRSAHLLYNIIKKKPFVRGNTRISCMLFLYYLKISNLNFIHLSPTLLSVLALFIETSKSYQKDKVIKLIINLIQ